MIQLVGDNYRRWKKAMLKALSVKNKLGLEEGTITETAENTFMWNRCNDMVSSWITLFHLKSMLHWMSLILRNRCGMISKIALAKKSGSLLFQVK